MPHCLTKLIKQMKSFTFIVKIQTLCEELFEEEE